MRRVSVRVTGRVQGVFFRAACARLASDLRIAGWIRNAADGAVEAEFEGVHDAVERIVAWCRTGPAGADVAGVDVREVAVVGDREFRVVR
jgi:acylphosphatase